MTADLEDLARDLEAQLAVAEPQTSSAPLRFSPSAFVAWSYFGCRKQLRLSLEAGRRDGGRPADIFTAQDAFSDPEDVESGSTTAVAIAPLSSATTTARGNAFEASVIRFLRERVAGAAVIDFDEPPHKNEIPSDATPTQRFETMLRKVDEVFADSRRAVDTVYVAQIPLMAPPTLEHELFGNGGGVCFSRMKPDLLVFSRGQSITIVDIKSSAKMKVGHQMQVATYSLVLNALIAQHPQFSCTLSVDAVGRIWLPAPSSSQQRPWTEAPFDIAPAAAQVRGFCRDVLAPQVVRPADARRDVPFVLMSKCGGCDFKQLCRRDAAAAGAEAAEPVPDVLLPLLGGGGGGGNEPLPADFSLSNSVQLRRWRVACKAAALLHRRAISLVGDNVVAEQPGEPPLRDVGMQLSRRSRIALPTTAAVKKITAVWIVWSAAESVRPVPQRIVVAEALLPATTAEGGAPFSAATVLFDEQQQPGSDLVERVRAGMAVAERDESRVFVTWDARDHAFVTDALLSCDVFLPAAGGELAFCAPRVLCLCDAVEAHAALPVAGYPELSDVAKWLVVKPHSGAAAAAASAWLGATAALYVVRSLHRRYQRLDDIGLAGGAPAAAGQAVAGCIAECFAALIAFAAEHSGALRSTPALRRGEGDGAPSAALVPRPSSNLHQPTTPADDLFHRARAFLSLQASGTWLDRGNPAATLIGRFAPLQEQPSLCCIEVDLALPTITNSSNTLHARYYNRAVDQLVDVIAKDCVWQSAAAMTAALEAKARSPKHGGAAWVFCSRDKQLGPYSTAGRWYLAPAPPQPPADSKMVEFVYQSEGGFFPKTAAAAVGQSVEGAFLSGQYVLAPLGADIDAFIADETAVFSSKLDKAADKVGAEQLGLCDIVAVERVDDGGQGQQPRIRVFIYMTHTLRLHVGRSYVLSRRCVNTNKRKTIAALSKSPSTLLLDSATSAAPMLAAAPVVAASPLVRAVEAIQTHQSSPMIITDVHRRFLAEGVERCRTTLLLGPPGAGKTRSVSSMILGFCLQEGRSGPKRVLVVAATHKALEQVHEKLDASGMVLASPPAAGLRGRVVVQRIVSGFTSSATPSSSTATAAKAVGSSPLSSPVSPTPAPPAMPRRATDDDDDAPEMPPATSSSSSADGGGVAAPPKRGRPPKQQAAAASSGATYVSLGAVSKYESAAAHGDASHVVLATIWAASKLPTSKAALFDMLVIDEASQIQFVDAVAASTLLRNDDPASRVVVAGDPLQLSPIVGDATGASGGGGGSQLLRACAISACRSRCAEYLRASGSSLLVDGDEDDAIDDASPASSADFSLVTASVFDALLWQRSANNSATRFVDIPRISILPEGELLGVHQLPHSFRSTPQIVSILHQLYPRFECAPRRNAPQPGSVQPCRQGVFVTIIEDGAGEGDGDETDARTAQQESRHVVGRILELQRECPSATVAVIAPRRHQRAHIKAEMQQQQQQQNERGAVVIDTTERMQGDEADAVILAFADVRAPRFALNMRRINVAISRAKRYVELVVSRSLLALSPAGIAAMDREDARAARFSGTVRSHVAEAVQLLARLMQEAQRQQAEALGAAAAAASAASHH